VVWLLFDELLAFEEEEGEDVDGDISSDDWFERPEKHLGCLLIAGEASMHIGAANGHG
jgi:hypothetical protein